MPPASAECHPTLKDLDRARTVFETHVPRDVFYRAATNLVDLALREQVSINVAEALAVLLQTWNRPYYRFRPANAQHYDDLEAALAQHVVWLKDIRNRSIESFAPADEARLGTAFGGFETVLGPVGTAKALHLLAPHFLPLWDRQIAHKYGLTLHAVGTNGLRYVRMTRRVRAQVKCLGGISAIDGNPLKRIDEFNYCRAKSWM